MIYFLFVLIFVAGIISSIIIFKIRLNSLIRKGNTLLENPEAHSSSQPDSFLIPSEIQKLHKIAVEARLKNDSKIISESELQFRAVEEKNQQKKKIDNLYIVNELGRQVTSSLNLQQTFHYLYTTINSMMDAAVVELSVHQESNGEEKLFTNLEIHEGPDDKPYRNHMAEWCFNNNREVFLTDAENDYARYVFEPLILSDGRKAKSVIIFPVINHNKVSGTLCIISFQKKGFNEYHQEIIRLLLGYIAVAMDNALRHEELNLTKIRAEQSEKFKEKFLANMSHEIRTPINAVTGMTRLLLEKQPRTDQLLYLESIRNASDSLLVIINDILDLSKIEAGKIELEKIDFSLIDVIKNVKEIMRIKAEEKGLSLIDDIDMNIPPVIVGDPTRLIQILLNLLGNAIKFTNKGSVKIMAAAIEIKDQTDARIEFEITDTGIGMSEEQQALLFQDYAQASNDTSRKFGGTGLGLSISRQLVEMQGGRINVKSKSGVGSSFSFMLTYPISQNKSLVRSENNFSEEMLKELQGTRVLLADDNEYNRIVVKETLQMKIKDIVVDEALDGAAVLEMVRANNYDVLLLDVVMPVIDGLEATRIIRNQFPKPFCNTKIIALTASVVKSTIDKCYEAGMDGFIPKPFKSKELFAAMYHVLKDEGKFFIQEISDTKKTRRDSAIIDLKVLQEFTEGDEVRMMRYIELFLTKIPSKIKELKTALVEMNVESLRIISHSMKPQLQSLGVQKGFELAERIEQISTENKNTELLAGLVSELSTTCDNAISELNEKIKAAD